VETQKVQLDAQGRYTVLLGATEPDGLPLDLFTSSKARWLGVQPQLPGEGEQPRVLLVGVPYALKAADADTLGGKPLSAFVLAETASASSAIDSSSPSGRPAPQGQQAQSDAARRLSQASPMFGAACAQVTSSGTADFIAMFDPSTTTGCDFANSVISENGSIVDIGGNGTPATLQLPAKGIATSGGGFNSSPLDLQASSFNSSGAGSAVPQDFQWMAEPAGNNTGTPSATVNLLFGSNGATPSETGLSIASSGQISFAPGQIFPGTGSGTVTTVNTGSGLAGGPITTTGTISIPSAGVTNAMLANPSLTVTAGTDLTGGGVVALGNSVTLNLDTTKVPQLGAGSNTFTGSLTASSFSGSGSGLTGLNASSLTTGTVPTGALSGTYNIGISGNAASATTAANAVNLGGNAPSFYAAASSLSNYLPLAGGTLTGGLNGTAKM
jgi:hypothetical protein